MHTATRLAGPVIQKARRLNATARICAYGLYAPLNGPWLRSLGVDEVLGGEFEGELTTIAKAMAGPTTSAVGPTTSPAGPKDPPYIPTRPNAGGAEAGGTRHRDSRLQFLVPHRSGLPPLSRY